MEQRTPEWFEARKGRVTASMVGAILGLSPHMTSDDAMRAMVREALGAEREFTGNIATDYGTNSEPMALIDYRFETGNDVKRAGFIPFEDWLGCSPDGLIGDDGGLEIKCPFSLRNAEAPVPFKTIEEQPHYYAQVQVCMYVTWRDVWDFYQWTPNGTKLQTVYVDMPWQRRNIPRLKQFHAEFLDALKDPAEYLAPKRATIDTPEAHRMVKEWDELKEQAERIKERQTDLLANMTALAKDRNAMFAGRKLTLVEREGSVSYAKVVKEKLPSLDLAPYRGKPSKFWQVS